MNKIKVLVVPSDRTGVGKFRSVDPHIFLQNLYPEEFFIDIVYDVPLNNLDFYKKYDLIVFHRSLSPDFEKSVEIVTKLNELGIPTVADIDDYWMPGKEHPLHDVIKVNKLNERIVNSLK